MIRNPRLLRRTPALILLAPVGTWLAGPELTPINIAFLALACGAAVAWARWLGDDTASVLGVFGATTLARFGLTAWAVGVAPAARTPIVLMMLVYLIGELTLLATCQERTTAEVSA